MENCSRRHFLRGSAGVAGLLTLTGGATAVSAAAAANTDLTETGAAIPEDRPLDSELFRQAVEAGELERVRAYLERDPGLRYCRDDSGRSVFVLAHLAGHPKIGQLLIEQGLELDVVEASIIGDWSRVDALCAVAPGSVNAAHPFGGTAMHAAARFGHGGRLWNLYKYGADPNANPLGPEEGTTPARSSLDGDDPEAVEVTLSDLLGNGGDANAAQRDGDSVLHAAAAVGSGYLVELVLRKHGDPTARNKAGKTPFDVALERGDAEIIALLRHPEKVPRDHISSRFAYDASGGRFEMPPPSGLPAPLVNTFVGAAHGNFDAVKEMAVAYPGLLFGISSADEMTVEASAHMGRRDMVQFFLDHGAPMSLLTSLTVGDVDRARQLLREDPRRIRERGPHDFPLMWYPAIGGGNVEAMELLLEYGGDLESERLGQTVLHWAARAGQTELVEFLVARGADVDARQRRDGKTPVDLALEREHTVVVQLLRRG